MIRKRYGCCPSGVREDSGLDPDDPPGCLLVVLGQSLKVSGHVQQLLRSWFPKIQALTIESLHITPEKSPRPDTLAEDATDLELVVQEGNDTCPETGGRYFVCATVLFLGKFSQEMRPVRILEEVYLKPII